MTDPAPRAGVSAAYVSLAPTLERDVPTECPNCGSENVVEDWRQGQLICRGCGLVLSEQLFDLGTEWRTFANDDSGGTDMNRVSGPANPLYENDQGTGIGAAAGSGPAQATAAGEKGAGLVGALHRAQYNSKNAASEADRQVRAAEEKMQTIAERASLPRRVQDRALEIFKRYYDFLTLKPDGVSRSRALKNDEKSDIVAAAIYTACGIEGIPRGLAEIWGVTGVPKKRISATHKAMKRNLDGLHAANVQNPEEFVARFVSRLGLPREYVAFVAHVAKYASELSQIYGRTYQTIVAAAIFVICSLSPAKNKRTAKEIGEVVGVAEATIRQAKNDIANDLEKVLPPDFQPAEALSVLTGPATKKQRVE